MFSVCIHWIVHLHAPSFAYLITPGVGVEGEFPCENVGDARREKRPFWVCLELYLSPERYHFKTDRKAFFVNNFFEFKPTRYLDCLKKKIKNHPQNSK